jgi:hypothetical protein
MITTDNEQKFTLEGVTETADLEDAQQFEERDGGERELADRSKASKIPSRS